MSLCVLLKLSETSRNTAVGRLCLDGASEEFKSLIHVPAKCRQEGCIFIEDERVARFECDSLLEHVPRLDGVSEFGRKKDGVVVKKCGVGGVGGESLLKHVLRLIKAVVVLQENRVIVESSRV